MNESPSWARVPLGVYSPVLEMRQKRAVRRPRDKCDTPTKFEGIILRGMHTHPTPCFASHICDAIQATPQRRRDIHSYMKKLIEKGYVSVEDYLNGMRGPPRPLFKLTPKALTWLTKA